MVNIVHTEVNIVHTDHQIALKFNSTENRPVLTAISIVEGPDGKI
jgi:hypothetical protein